MFQAIINNTNSYSVSTEEGNQTINDVPVAADIQYQPNGLISILLNNKSYTGMIESIDRKTKEVTLRIDGQLQVVTIKEEIDLLLSKMGLDLAAIQKTEPVKAPMPGMILKVLVTPGQQINKGDALLVLEAMKMENILKATGSAVVKTIRAEEKKAVEKGAVLIELE